MWEPRRLTTLWASTACYRDSFTFFFLPLYLRFRKVNSKCIKHDAQYFPIQFKKFPTAHDCHNKSPPKHPSLSQFSSLYLDYVYLTLITAWACLQVPCFRRRFGIPAFSRHASPEVSMTVTMKNIILWQVMPTYLEVVSRRLAEAYWLHLHDHTLSWASKQASRFAAGVLGLSSSESWETSIRLHGITSQKMGAYSQVPYCFCLDIIDTQ
jgi:hypothetical protein